MLLEPEVAPLVASVDIRGVLACREKRRKGKITLCALHVPVSFNVCVNHAIKKNRGSIVRTLYSQDTMCVT